MYTENDDGGGMETTTRTTETFTVYRIDDAGKWHAVAVRRGLNRAWPLLKKLARQNPGIEYRLN
jgi:hypothetical protein